MKLSFATIPLSVVLFWGTSFNVGTSICCAGLYQAVVRVPDSLLPGDHEVVITVDGISSPMGPFITVGQP